MTYSSFTDLYAALGVLREHGDTAAALALLTQHSDAFPRHRATIYLTEAELLAESDRPTDALDVLEGALAQGCRYPRAWLEKNQRLGSVVALAGFSAFALRSQARWDAAAAESKPARTLLMPQSVAPASGYPILLVLHGNNSSMDETVPIWSSAADHGWITAVLQSSEPGATPGAFTWNDRDKTEGEVRTHLDAIRLEVHVDERALVLAGFSMGALQAIALVITGRIRARGVVPIAAWLPHIREFTTLADTGRASIRPTYVVVGSKDPSDAGAKQLVALMSRHGGRAQLDERSGLGHEYPSDMASTLARALAFVSD
jgi:pimeloyl-ACP methyl ester carboxylesterase